MQTAKSTWDVERAAAWLRRHTWGPRGEAPPPPMDEAVLAAAQAEADAGAVFDELVVCEHERLAHQEAGPEDLEDQDEIDIACWPALVAPFYD